jgi:CubicO group peptidase (beta-lactamase class C family)
MSHNHLVNVYSCGKALEALGIALLAERHQLDYDDHVYNIWPEFASLADAERAAKGDADLARRYHEAKRQIRLAELLRHDSNIGWFNDSRPAKLEELGTPALAARLASMPSNNVGGSPRRDYHALLRGLLLSQIAQRADPRDRTLGQIIEEDVAAPLGVTPNELVANGLRPGGHAQDARYARVVQMQPLSLLRAVLIPWVLGPLGLAKPLGGQTSIIMPGTLNPSSPVALSTTSSVDLGDLFARPSRFSSNLEPFLRAEITSGGVLTNARSLGRILAMAANGGELDGVRVLQEEELDRALGDVRGAPEGSDSSFMQHAHFSRGGFGRITRASLRAEQASNLTFAEDEELFGWFGASGAQAWFSRKHNFAFAFVPSCVFTLDLFDLEEMAQMLDVIATQGHGDHDRAAKEKEVVAAKQQAAKEAADEKKRQDEEARRHETEEMLRKEQAAAAAVHAGKLAEERATDAAKSVEAQQRRKAAKAEKEKAASGASKEKAAAAAVHAEKLAEERAKDGAK